MRKLLHKWFGCFPKLVWRTQTQQYCECFYCHKRTVFRIPGNGYQPIDSDWLNHRE